MTLTQLHIFDMHCALKSLILAMISFALGMAISGFRMHNPEAGDGPTNRKVSGHSARQRAGAHSANARQQTTARFDKLIEQVAVVDSSVVMEVNRFMEGRRRLLIFEKLLKQNIERAVEVFEGFEDLETKEREALIGSLISEWSSKDPENALSWLERNLDGLGLQAIDRLRGLIYQDLAGKDPLGAASRLETLSDEGLRENGFYSLAEQWVTDDPDAAFAWLDGLQPSDSFHEFRDQCRFEMLKQLILTKPEAALSKIMTHESKTLREALMPKAVLSLGRENLDSAIAWFSSLTNAEERAVGLEALVRSSSVADPRKVFELVQREPLDPTRKTELLGGVLENMAARNSEEAVALLSRQPPGSQKVMAAALTHGLLSHREQKAIEWARQQGPGAILDGAAAVIASEVHRSDPRGAMEWLSKISEPAEKAGLVRELIQRTKVDALAAIQDALHGTGLGVDQLAPLNQLIEDRLQEGYAELLIPQP